MAWRYTDMDSLLRRGKMAIIERTTYGFHMSFYHLWEQPVKLYVFDFSGILGTPHKVAAQVPWGLHRVQLKLSLQGSSWRENRFGCWQSSLFWWPFTATVADLPELEVQNHGNQNGQNFCFAPLFFVFACVFSFGGWYSQKTGVRKFMTIAVRLHPMFGCRKTPYFTIISGSKWTCPVNQSKLFPFHLLSFRKDLWIVLTWLWAPHLLLMAGEGCALSFSLLVAWTIVVSCSWPAVAPLLPPPAVQPLPGRGGWTDWLVSRGVVVRLVGLHWGDQQGWSEKMS